MGWGFSLADDLKIQGLRLLSGRNPFQGGMGFFTGRGRQVREYPSESQSLSGWDGVFHQRIEVRMAPGDEGRNPFQGGMGFFTVTFWRGKLAELKLSQSLSGWDGVFHRCG